MEKIVRNEKTVELENYFEGVWASLWRIGRDIELQTDELKTPFVVRAKIARRKGSIEEALVFLRDAGNGELKECSRCYMADWECYFNHFGKEGQRIGMYCKAADSWVMSKSIQKEVD